MSLRSLITLTSAVLATVPHATADILSCADVDCPIVDGTTSATCKVGDKAFNGVGVVNIDTDVDELEGLTWTKAVGADDVGSEERIYRQSFYLGTSDGFSLNNTGACAVFFDRVSERVRFGEGDPRNREGTCSDAISEDCISALLDRARKVDFAFAGLSSEEACKELEDQFSNNLDSACADFSTLKTGWVELHAHPLSGENAAEPISDQQNGTSTCWPVLPKSHDLTLVQTIDAKGDIMVGTLLSNFFSVTPVLTVFFPGEGGSESLVAQPEAQLSCLKPVDLTTASEDTQGENGAVGGLVGGRAAVWAGLMTAVFAVFMC